MMIYRSDKSGHPCFVSYLRGKAFRPSPLNVMLAIDFFIYALHRVEKKNIIENGILSFFLGILRYSLGISFTDC